MNPLVSFALQDGGLDHIGTLFTALAIWLATEGHYVEASIAGVIGLSIMIGRKIYMHYKKPEKTKGQKPSKE